MKKFIFLLFFLMTGIQMASAQRSYGDINVKDVNGDNSIGVDDVTYLSKVVLGTSTPKYGNADVNGDGSTNSADVAALVDFIQHHANLAFLYIYVDFPCKQITLTANSGITLVGDEKSVTVTAEEGSMLQPGYHTFAVDSKSYTGGFNFAFSGIYGAASSNYSWGSDAITLTPAASHIYPLDIVNYDDLGVNTLLGEGTESNPYLLHSANDWITMANIFGKDENKCVNYQDKYYKMVNDIDFKGEIAPTVGVTYHFQGHFDGDGHKIVNYKTGLDWYASSAESRYFSGLFAHLKGAEIKNLWLECSGVSTRSGDGYLGVSPFVAYVELDESKTTTIENCHVSGYQGMTLSASELDIVSGVGNYDVNYGGFVALCMGNLTIRNCTNSLNFDLRLTNDLDTFSANMGGFVGKAKNIITSVTVTTYSLTIDRCRNTGNQTMTGKEDLFVGGILGFYSGESAKVSITNCVNSGNITAGKSDETSTFADNAMAGGIVGQLCDDQDRDPKIYNCLNSGTIYANQCDDWAGGLMAYNYDEYLYVFNFASTGKVNSADKYNPLCADYKESQPSYYICYWTQAAGGENYQENITCEMMNEHLTTGITEKGYPASPYSLCKWVGNSADGSLDIDFDSDEK